MARSYLENPDSWRARAEEARFTAGQMEGEPRKIMLLIAGNYDRLAELANQHSWKENPPSWWRQPLHSN